MQLLINLIVGVIVAIIVKFILDYLDIPSPLDWLVSLVVFLLVAFGNRLAVWR